MSDTIFALSSGALPAAVAIIRISGEGTQSALTALMKKLPEPRRAALRILRDAGGDVLDHALILWLPGPQTVTGEDMAELHCHGGRAVVAAVQEALAKIPGLRRAEAGEFTRRAFSNGKIDLSEAEGLADLLTAETELQRRSAIAMAGGSFSTRVEDWRDRLLGCSAAVEAVLDFADEDDVSALPANFHERLETLRSEICDWLERPRAETLREGFHVVLAGPPNAGKSSLFNALVESEAAITAPVAGTTRDVLTKPVALAGIPFLFADTAGLREDAGDEIEAIGIDRAKAELDRADVILWLGPENEAPEYAWQIEPQIDRADHIPKSQPRHRISVVTDAGLDALRLDLIETARKAMPKPGEAALNARQHRLLEDADMALSMATRHQDPLLVAENLRLARLSFDSLIGRSTTEDMLGALFGRFCIGK